ncbi:MAG TPA: cytochrome c oxidase subunit II [Actinomycetota bacterium]|nr:cytochrome c oxidase subunit II [Actinomycetota bacterium]
MLRPHGTESRSVASVWWLMFGLAAGVYVIVATLIVVAIVRGRRQQEGLERGPKDDQFIWFGGILAPLVILALLAVVTISTTRTVRAVTPGELKIQVVGKRWWWDVRYPDSRVATANEIHIPVGQPVDIVLTADDVIHSFWVPQLAGKVDTIPGQVNHLRLKATAVGTYRWECAEFCGIQHANMNFDLVAEAPADFDRWLTRQAGGAGITPSSDQAAQGELVFMRESCAGCHTIRGTQATGTTGPDLTYFGSRASIGALTLPNTPGNLARWITDPQSIKPGNLMPPTDLSPRDLSALVTYLEGLK